MASVAHEPAPALPQLHVGQVGSWHWSLVLGIWQILSVTLTLSGVFTQLLSSNGVNIATAQSFTVYAALTVFWIPLVRLRCAWAGGTPLPLSQEESQDKVAWWKYLLLALIDVEANFMLVKAYQYTTIEYVQLLNSFTIPSVMVFSWLFFKVTYARAHFVGIVIAILGSILLVVSSLGTPGASDKAIGDVLTVGASVLFSLSNLGQEAIVKAHSRVEFLAMMGTFGALISLIQFLSLEIGALQAVNWSIPAMGAYWFGFTCTMLVNYTVVPVMLEQSTAVTMNVSFLTSDVFAVFFAVGMFGASLSALYFVAFFGILFGMFIYNLAEHGFTLTDMFNMVRRCECTQPTPPHVVTSEAEAFRYNETDDMQLVVDPVGTENPSNVQ